MRCELNLSILSMNVRGGFKGEKVEELTVSLDGGSNGVRTTRRRPSTRSTAVSVSGERNRGSNQAMRRGERVGH